MAYALIILALVLPYMAASWTWRRVRGSLAMKRLMVLTAGATRDHAAALVAKERQTVHKNEYGVHEFDLLNTEIRRFVTTVVLPKARRGDFSSAARCFAVRDELHDLVQRCLYEIHIPEAADKDVDHPVVIPTGHKEFEHFCADELRHQGWEACVIGGSGDQGADVIASKDGVVIVAQCKRWASPVTNKAVQEVAAARAHYEASQALVVSVSGFTPSAIQLAETNGVHLCDAVDLAHGDAEWMH